MCGIIGYIGPQDAVPLLINGLRRLEYRGYDSAGIAVVSHGRVHVRRSAGKLSRLEELINGDPIHGNYGIGHTRWATHGRPTAENAHPHRDCSGRIVLVHNGIIENYADLKRRLLADGHRFETETDTEVVAHLVEQEWREDGLDNAIRRALTSLRGLFGLVVVAADDPDKIVAVRNGPPIVVGLGQGEFLVASDVSAIMTHTRDVVFLENAEMAVIRRSAVEFTDYQGTAVPRTVHRVPWDSALAEKGAYRHFMQKEIFEQPAAVEQTLLGRICSSNGTVALDDLAPLSDRLQHTDRVHIVACGTSWHAGLIGKYLIEQLARLPVEVDYGSEYRYRHPLAGEQVLAIAITQSGETADTLAALKEARHRGAATVVICNVVGSMATREADATVYTHAGPEIGVASTKAFTTQLVALHLLALDLAQRRRMLAPGCLRLQVEALAALPRLLEQTLECGALVQDVARCHHQRRDVLFLARGINHPIALEGALKLKEISYIHAEGYAAGEMKHGPIALLDESVPVVAVAPRDPLFEKVVGNLQEAKARGAPVILVTDGDLGALTSMFDPLHDRVVRIPATHPLVAPVLTVVPLQLLAYHIAALRGCDVDQPRNLAKSVTVE